MKTKILFCYLLLFLITPTNKAQQWEFVGLDSLLIKQIYVSGDTILAGTAVTNGANINGGIYFTSNLGSSWIQIDSAIGNGSVVAMENLGNGTIYVSKGLSQFSLAGTLFKTTNLGKNWEIVQQLENIGIDWIGISAFNKNEIYVKQFAYLTAGQFETIYRSLDYGSNWNEITSFPSSSHGRSMSFNLSSIDSNTLYASVDDRMFDTYFYRSSNKGESWMYISEPPAVEQELITDPNSPNSVFIFSGYHITTDGGYSWSVADSGLADVISYLSFYVDPLDKTTFYNLRKDGLFISKNNPIKWQLIEGSDSLPLNLGTQGFQYWHIGQLRNVFIDTLTKEIYVGTALGIYKKDLITNVDEIINYLPAGFILEQNYPNPFNPVTTILIQIPEKSFVTIKVYDVLGKELTTLINEEKSVGEYRIQFNGSDLPSGVYIYELTAITENGINIRKGKKMLLLK